MIFYFSATGNSQYIAQRLAEVTGETLVSITECLKNHKYTWELLPGERVGFVTPVYFFGLPSIVSEFIRSRATFRLSCRNFWNYNGTVPLYDGKGIEKEGIKFGR